MSQSPSPTQPRPRVPSSGKDPLPFGGTWLDQSDAPSRLASLLERGQLSPDNHSHLEHFRDKGFLVLEGAVSQDQLTAMQGALDRSWASGDRRIHVEHFLRGEKALEPVRPELRHERTKLLDAYAWSEEVRAGLFRDPLIGVLRSLFDSDPMAFQSLYFERGTEQPIHQDTAFVGVRRPLEFVGTWLALEDIHEGSGELEYYEGSHRIPHYEFPGPSKKMPAQYPDEQRYLDSLHQKSQERGLVRSQFRPRRGDLVIWHADLCHGGSRQTNPALTRRSLVTHFCPVDNDPDYFSKYPHGGRQRHAPSGAYFCHPLRDSNSWWGRLGLRGVALAKMSLHRLRGR